VTEWLGRLGAALLAGVALGALIWVLSAILILLDAVVPWEIAAQWAVVIFVLTLAGDWAFDTYQTHQKRNAYELARRAAMARDDDEL